MIDINWTAHTDKIACKISRTIGVLNRLKHIIPKYILQSIYSTLLVCHLNYGILAWGHKLNRIAKLQKRAIRTISCNKFNAHSEPIFKELNLLKVSDIFKLHQLKLYYKPVNRQLPVYFNCITLHNINDLHQYTTRAANNLFTPRVTHEFAKRCIRYSVIKTVNNSPDLIKNKIHTHSIHAFCCYIKKHYLHNYESICHVINCYVCQH